ncbi:multiple sugar transport system substrate-binding protein [Paenibacillus sp. DS2015]|uniref:extracellular solute-binding protein n=1 Tax=Paenibacillus sp. DS2015 TaxID=3373917 RepID=UPI003D2282BC
MMKRKNYWFLFAILLLSLTSLSPSLDFDYNNRLNDTKDPSRLLYPDSPDQATNQEPIQITVQLSTEEFAQLELKNKSFMQGTGIQVELSNIPLDDPNKLFHSLAIGEGPDVMLVNSEEVYSLATKGYLLPVESYQTHSPESSALSSLLSLMEWNGYQWGIPYDMDPYVMQWQSLVLETLGFKEPPRTLLDWSDLLVKVQESKGKYLLAMESKQPYGLVALMDQVGGDITNPEEEPLNWIEQALPYMYILDNHVEESEGIALEDIPLVISPYSTAALVQEEGMLLELSESVYASHPILLRSRALAVSSHSSLPEQSAEWIAYMTSPNVEMERFRATHHLPVVRSLYNHSTFVSVDLSITLNKLLENSSDLNMNAIQKKDLSTLTTYINQLLKGSITKDEFKEYMKNGEDLKPK